MKTIELKQFKVVLMIATLLSVMGLMGCSKGGTQGPTQVVTDGVNTPAGNGYNPADWDNTGQTVAFAPSSFGVFNSYVGTHPLNDPSDYKINLTLAQADDGAYYYGGTIKIGYYDVGSWYQGVFTAGTGKNASCSGCKDNDAYESTPNTFYMTGGKKVFSGFFQDRYGAIVVTLEPSSGSGDGDSGLYQGTVWFKNFDNALASQSTYRKCWWIYSGPYQCRAANVINKTSYTSIDGYTKLGTFTGIDLKKIAP